MFILGGESNIVMEECNDKVSSGTNYKEGHSKHNDAFKPICVQNIIKKVSIMLSHTC